MPLRDAGGVLPRAGGEMGGGDRADRPQGRCWAAARAAAATVLAAGLLASNPGRAADLDPEWLAVMRRHVAEAVAAEPETLDQWDAAKWAPGYEADPPWVEHGDFGLRQRQLTAYREAYEAAVAPGRAAAARRIAAETAAMFDVDAGIERPPALKACRNRTGLEPGKFNTGQPPDLAKERQKLQSLTDAKALAWTDVPRLVAATCRVQHLAATASRVTLALKAAGIEGALGSGGELAVPAHSDGRLIAYNPAAMVRAAAADGIQVAFQSGGRFQRTVTMTITPFGRGSPRLEGDVAERRNPDGTVAHVVTSLANLPAMRSPEETVGCLALPIEEAMNGARSGVLGSAVDILLGRGNRSLEEGVRRAEEIEGCAASKAAFVGGSR